MDAPTDIPLKIQLGLKYHASTTEEQAHTDPGDSLCLNYGITVVH